IYNEHITDHKSTSKYLNDTLEHIEKRLSCTLVKHKYGCIYDYALTSIIKLFKENAQKHIKDYQAT
ncbi:hypothetical protein PVBG_05489, partial [Plasmodium vivax Brazil I]